MKIFDILKLNFLIPFFRFRLLEYIFRIYTTNVNDNLTTA